MSIRKYGILLSVFVFYTYSSCALTTLHVSLPTNDNPGGQGQNGDLWYAINTMNYDLNNGIVDDYAIFSPHFS